VLLTTLLLTTFTPHQAFADPADQEAGPYTVVLSYEDDIQMKYVIRHGYDDWWSGAGDIPLGGVGPRGAGATVSQLYCVDATVAYHSYAGTQTSWVPGTGTTDTTGNYAVATPTALSDAARANLGELYWLTINGYAGTQASLDALVAKYGYLSASYGNQPITRTIAIMSTKTAVWHFTDPTFALLSTSLTKDPSNPTPTERNNYELMIALEKAMVADAQTEAAQALDAATHLDVTIDNTVASVFNSTAIGGKYFYGPLTATETLVNSTGSGTPDSIFLGVGGVSAEGIGFYKGVGPTPSVTEELPTGPMYGTNTQSPYVTSGEQFWLAIPETRLTQLGIAANDAAAYLVVHALGKVNAQTNSSTPVILVYQGAGGVQDWHEVQAFIGLAGPGIAANIFGEAALLLPSAAAADGEIYVAKILAGTDGTNETGLFKFRITKYNAGDYTPVVLVPGPDGNLTGAGGIGQISMDGTFLLAGGQTAKINKLPQGTYHITEMNGPSGVSFTISSQLDTLAPTSDSTVEASLTPQVQMRHIAFTNTITSPPPTPRFIDGKLILTKSFKSTAGASLTGSFQFSITAQVKDIIVPVSLAVGPRPSSVPLGTLNGDGRPLGFVTGASRFVADNTNGIVQVSSGEQVEIANLCPGDYTITETADGTSYTTTFAVDGGTPTTGSSAKLQFSDASESHSIAVVNTKTPGTPVTPVTPTTPVIPATDDTLLGNSLPLVLLLAGAGLLSLFTGYRMRRTRRSDSR
jgi:hypothetical protein